MPLVQGSSNAAISENIRRLSHEVGTSPHVKSMDQAKAIAYSTARRSGRASGGLVRGYDDGGAVQSVLQALQAGAQSSGFGTASMGSGNPVAPSSPQATAATNGVAPAQPMAPAAGQPGSNPAITGGVAQNVSGQMPPPVGAGLGGSAPQSNAPTSTMQPVTPMMAGNIPMGMPALGMPQPGVNNPMSRPLMNTGGALDRASGGFNLAKSMRLPKLPSLMHGPILSAVPGRTDNHHAQVPSGSYVLPAAHVASMGQGNSVAGLSSAHAMFGPGGPYGAGITKMGHGAGLPKPPKSAKFADGGYSEGGSRGHGDHIPVDVMLAGGEYIIHPSIVRAIGKGSLKNGHAILDAYVMHARKKEIKTLKNLPPPAKK